jgi:hypothetical protein
VRKPSFAVTLGLAALLFAGSAQAGDNDLQLWRLGHPETIRVCSLCDGSPGDKKDEFRDFDKDAQRRFARLGASLGLSFVPGFVEPAASTGQSGFELGFSQTGALLKLDADEWATVGTQATSTPPALLSVSTLTLRKGFGGSLEIGMQASYLAGSQILALGAQVRFGLIDGIDYAPDLGLRAWGSRLVGAGEMDLSMAGADALLSKSIGLAGMVKLQPFFSYGVVMIHVTSGVVDFKPDLEDPKDPTADDGVFHTVKLQDNVYHRFSGGLRLVAGSAMVGFEGGTAFGTNSVQSDKLPGGLAPGTQSTRVISGSLRLGVAF